MALNPKVWGPHYWFVLHTIALTYPLHPNETIKKKYYDLINNLPIFIPIRIKQLYLCKVLFDKRQPLKVYGNDNFSSVINIQKYRCVELSIH